MNRLIEVVDRLSEFDDNGTIYASEPWTETSCAIVAVEPEVGGLPLEAAERGVTYFLEVSIARDFIEDWQSLQNEKVTSSDICRRLIQYATNDA